MHIMVYTAPGSIVAFFGFAVVVVQVIQARPEKNKLGRTIRALSDGTHGPDPRRRFLGGLMAMGLGAVVAFVGVAMHDSARSGRCREACTAKGYADADIRGSTEMRGPGSHAFVACACSDGPDPDPLELRANDL